MDKKKYESITGTEYEDVYGDTNDPVISEPFNPKNVDVVTRVFTLSNIVDLIRYGDIDLAPDFQRNKVWTDVQQSRLIESLLISIPLPSFYFDEADDEKLVVVDGLQRLWTFQRFCVFDKNNSQKLKLDNLEYLKEFEGCYFEDLPLQLQRRLNSTNFNAYIIRPGTPEEVRISVFTRINTGGINLEKAEIRNSVYRGRAADTLKSLAQSEEFIRATRGKIKPDRMNDCEIINRFMAFHILTMDEYSENLEIFLDKALKKMKYSTDEELSKWTSNFLEAMKLSYKIFREKAFRKIQSNGRYGSINKPLFECVSVSLANLSKEERITVIEKKEKFSKKYKELLIDEEFVSAITSGTAKISSIKTRYTMLDRVIREVLQ